MRIKFFGQTPKDVNHPELNEDCGRHNETVAVLCDGASESYDSRTWARLLTALYLRNQRLDRAWMRNATAAYAKRCDVAKMSWAQEAAFQRGSFATLLGLVFDPLNRTATVTAIGDSVALLVRDDSIEASFPYDHPRCFADRPVLLSTNAAQNRTLFAGDFLATHTRVWRMDDKNLEILLLTDALAEWVLKRKNRGWLNLLTRLARQEDFRRLIREERELKRMRVDDCTLMHITFND